MIYVFPWMNLDWSLESRSHLQICSTYLNLLGIFAWKLHWSCSLPALCLHVFTVRDVAWLMIFAGFHFTVLWMDRNVRQLPMCNLEWLLWIINPDATKLANGTLISCRCNIFFINLRVTTGGLIPVSWLFLCLHCLVLVQTWAFLACFIVSD